MTRATATARSMGLHANRSASAAQPAQVVDKNPMVSLEPGIHLLHKPAGPSSFSMVQPFLAQARSRKPRLPVCHGGALDPFAEGLLPVLVARATRVFELLHPIPKEYEAEVRWGSETDNGDPLGAVVARG